VTISSSPLNFTLIGTLPNAFKYTVNGVQNNNYNSLCNSFNNTPPLAAVGALSFRIESTYTFKPGETLLFSPAGTPVAHGTALLLEPGFRKQGGHYFALKRDDNTGFPAPPPSKPTPNSTPSITTGPMGSASTSTCPSAAPGISFTA